MKEAPCEELTPREVAVLRGVVDGHTYQQIAETLNLGYETVNTYMKRIRKKLNVRTRTEMAVLAIRNQLV